jgi:hypothetical protein
LEDTAKRQVAIKPSLTHCSYLTYLALTHLALEGGHKYDPTNCHYLTHLAALEGCELCLIKTVWSLSDIVWDLGKIVPHQ